MDFDKTRYLPKKKAPSQELAATVDLFRVFIGESDFCKLHKTKEQAYTFWLRKCKGCSYSKALEIIKSLEDLPLQYNKAGTIINRLKK